MLRMRFVLRCYMKGISLEEVLLKGGQGLIGCGKSCLAGFVDSSGKVHTISRPQLLQIQPQAPSGSIPHLLSTQWQLQSPQFLRPYKVMDARRLILHRRKCILEHDPSSEYMLLLL